MRQVKGDIVLTNQDLQLVAQGQQDLADDQTRTRRSPSWKPKLMTSESRPLNAVSGSTTQSLTLKATRILVSITPMS